MASSPITSWQIDGATVETVTDFIFLGTKITADGDCSHEIERCQLLGRTAVTNLDSVLKSRDIALLTKVRLVKAMIFPEVMYRCESWTIKKALKSTEELILLNCGAGEDSWEFLDCKKTKQVNPKGNPKGTLNIHWTDWCWSWSPILWPPDMKSWLTRKDPDAGKDWKQEEKGTTEDELVGWHHWLSGHEFEQALGDSEGHGSLWCAAVHGVTKR